MEKKKGYQMPHTYIIIFGVILFAALLTVFIPLGKYDTKEITYMQNGVEKTRTVLDPESFQYILDENGNKVTKAAPSRRPSGLRKTRTESNSLAHRTTWLRSDLCGLKSEYERRNL